MPGVAFPGLIVSLQFNDNAKLQHYLNIFDTFVADRKCEILGKPGLEKTALQFFSNAVANTCMDYLDILEGNVTRGI